MTSLADMPAEEWFCFFAGTLLPILVAFGYGAVIVKRSFFPPSASPGGSVTLECWKRRSGAGRITGSQKPR